MIRVLFCTLLVSCGTNSSRESSVPPPSRSVVAPSPAIGDDTRPEPAQEAARPQLTNAEPWAMPAGRIGRLRNVNGEMFAVFGAQDPRFVGRLWMRDNYGDNWIETRIVAAGKYRPPSHVLGVPLDPEGSAFSLELGAAVEVHDIYADAVIGRPHVDDLAARGFRVTKCGRWAPSFDTCNEGDLVIVGPVTKVPVPASPNAAASEEVRALYARARGGRAPGVRAVILDRQLGLYWAIEEGERAGGQEPIEYAID